MKTLLRVLVVSLFAFQALLFVSTGTEARCLPTLSLESNNGFMKAGFGGRRRPSPPPPPHYSPGPIEKLKSPPTPTAYVTRRRRSPPPPPHYSPGPTPGLSTVPLALKVKDLPYENSPPNPYAAST